MENTVAINLYHLSLQHQKTNIFYFKSRQQEEVDFVVKEGTKIKQLIQVCYDISNPDTKEREIKALLKASEELKCNNLLIISHDKEGEEKTKGKKIKYVPLWKWLLTA